MNQPEIDLLTINRGAVTAPAGCGKTHLIAMALSRHQGAKPILILTHTNAGVAALKARLDKASVSSRSYRLATIDGFAMRLVGMFPQRSGVDPAALELKDRKQDYPQIRQAAINLVRGQHLDDVLPATYDRLIVDEYQDCSVRQHDFIACLAQFLPACVLGDPMQAIFGFKGNPLADWNSEVCQHFPISGELTTPWRWDNAGTDDFGRWLLSARNDLQRGRCINMANLPSEVVWVQLDGDVQGDFVKRQSAARETAPGGDGKTLIIGDSKYPPRQQHFAAKTPGTVVVENVDLTDFVTFARSFDFSAEDAIGDLLDFAAKLMTGVGRADMKRRLDTLQRGTARRAPSDAERVALDFCHDPRPQSAARLLSALSQQGGSNTYRPAVLRACLKALQQCATSDGSDFPDAAMRIREQNRLIGRPLAKRSVGSTLLLKGLEAEVCVILNADDLNANNLYVAMTRGSKKLVICSRSPYLPPRTS